MSTIPRRRIALRVTIALSLAAFVLVSRVAAQRPNAGVAALEDVGRMIAVSLALFGILLFVAPDFTRRAADLICEKPGKCFLYGSGGTVLLIFAMFLIRPTVSFPLIFLLVFAVSSIGFLAVGRVVSDSWIVAVPVAVLVSTVAGAIPYLNVLVGLVLMCQGLGAAYLVLGGEDETDEEASSRFSTENLSQR